MGAGCLAWVRCGGKAEQVVPKEPSGAKAGRGKPALASAKNGAAEQETVPAAKPRPKTAHVHMQNSMKSQASDQSAAVHVAGGTAHVVEDIRNKSMAAARSTREGRQRKPLVPQHVAERMMKEFGPPARVERRSLPLGAEGAATPPRRATTLGLGDSNGGLRPTLLASQDRTGSVRSRLGAKTGSEQVLSEVVEEASAAIRMPAASAAAALPGAADPD
ncbi:unnamed protein product [Pedinophyceae sp. YPF-701]|nr:unnamed protein product [Pedinophyceae sp. YPF-701]